MDNIVNLTNLFPNEIRGLIEKLNQLLKQQEYSATTLCDFVNNERATIICPHCHSNYIIKNGHTRSGKQTYKCKDCGKRFNALTNTVFSYTHLSYIQLEKLFDCMRDKFSIRKVANLVNINPKTAYVYRHKILSTLVNIRNNIKLHGEIQADEYYTPINLKGTKPENMPRASKKRKSSGNGTKGISSHKVCVESGIDEFDNCFLEIVGTGPITSKMVEQSLTTKVSNVVKLITDCKSSYESVANNNGWNLIQIKSNGYTNENGDSLSVINSLHSGLSNFLSNFHGVSTNHLQNYLDWFVFDKYLTYTTDILGQSLEFQKQVVTKNTSIKNSNIFNNYSRLNYKEIYSNYE